MMYTVEDLWILAKMYMNYVNFISIWMIFNVINSFRHEERGWKKEDGPLGTFYVLTYPEIFGEDAEDICDLSEDDITLMPLLIIIISRYLIRTSRNTDESLLY